jgi:flagellar biogenesis protein FliO
VDIVKVPQELVQLALPLLLVGLLVLILMYSLVKMEQGNPQQMVKSCHALMVLLGNLASQELVQQDFLAI